MHRNYTVDDIARTLNVSKGTARRWLKSGLPAIRDRKPALVLGEDLIDFLKARARPKVRCGPGQFFCFRCRAPREPALAMAEVVSEAPGSVNLRAICVACETLMHRRVGQQELAAFGAGLDISFPQASARIGDSAVARVNDHLSEEPEDHAKAPSG